MLTRFIGLITVLLLAGCQHPPPTPRTASSALPPAEAEQTALGAQLQHHFVSNDAAVYPVVDALDAFAARILLARAAEKTLDLQYYIWQKDTTGQLMLASVLEAAERGVRVRVLLDDNGITDLDPWLAAANRQDNIEVRIFNPFIIRKPKWLSFAVDFERANRRMHNKAMIADNRLLIAGGRNIGDEYFGASSGIAFADVDVLLAGRVVEQTSSDFDRYWNSELAYPLENIDYQGELSIASFQQSTRELLQQAPAKRYLAAVREANFIQQLLKQELDTIKAPVTLISDPPLKTLGSAEKETLLFTQLQRAIGKPSSQLDLISPYFVPTKSGVKAFIAMQERGVKVRVLTNSLSATDVAAVHAGYAKFRKPLVKSGVEVYELSRLSSATKKERKLAAEKNALSAFGSSGASLHAKVFSIDSRKVFVGSFNFDPRSIHLNTELGFVIESPVLAKKVSDDFYRAYINHAYQVQVSENNTLYWLEYDETSDDKTIRYNNEPNASVWQRMAANVISWFPIDRLL